MVVSGSFKQQPQRAHSNRNNETLRKIRENTTRLTNKDHQQTRIHDFYYTTREQLLQTKAKNNDTQF